ncbi:hypothetical protein TRIUR3_08400 [Triticum urartu]|uniref:Uncharacterized protein n=2 Tax=Triticum TaxID=4564 RepID=A0A9R0UXE2_TRITD|nr:hypothetical protein TRIUR3_08400 [Triticum urartu]VAH06428.1 unnamed protein product [Triticum turgidum subsp. durum]
MDQVLNKVGSYWFSKRASKEIDSIGDDLNSVSSSIGGGAKWMVNKIKEKVDTSGYVYPLRIHAYPRSGHVFCTGKLQKALPDLLKEYDMPAGLFPRDTTNYEFNEETKKLTVYIPSACDVGYKDSSVVRFFTCVTGYLEKGKLSDIEGMKTKVLVWTKVTSIKTEGSKVHFTAGMKKTRSRDAYEVVRDGIIIDKF